MTMEASLLLTTRLLAFNMLLQAIEIFILSRRTDFQHIWSYANLSSDLEKGLPLPKSLVRFLFSISSLQKITLLQIGLACALFFHAHALVAFFLFLTHLIICIRFRGSFNGGSDMMTFIVLTGVLIASLGYPKVGLIYIATHALYSYFKAGLAKAKHREWWNGKALPVFLSRSLFPEIGKFSAKLTEKPVSSKILGWLTIGFEFAALGLLVIPELTQLYLALAIVFHLVIYFSFGLNRFFWIWLSAWPATLFSLGLLV